MTPWRTQLRDQIGQALGNRRLVWFGIRGDDARPLLSIPQFTHCLSLVAPLSPNTLAEECLETLSRQRIDLNGPRTEDDEHTAKLHSELLNACSVPSVLVAYRPTDFIASAYFSGSSVEYLGLFHGLQAAFEHKPWVETELQKRGIPTVMWRYIADDDPAKEELIEAELDKGPLVVRRNRTSGGVGLELLLTSDDVLAREPIHSDGFLAYARYFSTAVPLNVGGCVFADGSVRLHSPSLQLIGIRSCTDRRFGYCGNDFARVRDLDDAAIDSLERLTLATGSWLYSMGYRGAFGVDALLDGHQVLLTEVNPRFQGSSAVGARLSAQMGLPDIFTDHLAAMLGLPPAPAVSLRDLAQNQESISQVIAYNRSGAPLHLVSEEAARAADDLSLLPEVGIAVREEAILFRLLQIGTVTVGGLEICPEVDAHIADAVSTLFV